MLCDEQLPWSKEVRPNAFFFGNTDNHPNPPPPPPLRYSKRSTIHILQCSRTSMRHLGDLLSHMGARPNANVPMISHGCHGGPFSFLLVSWFINVSQRLSVFKVASASKYRKCQWSSTKDKENTIYRKFISLCLFVCLFDWFFRSRRMRSQRYWAKTTNCTRQQGDKWCMALADQYILGR